MQIEIKTAIFVCPGIWQIQKYTLRIFRECMPLWGRRTSSDKVLFRNVLLLSKDEAAVERSRCMTDLKQYFPMIRERKEVLEEIGKKDRLRVMFASWTKEQQEEFLNWCTGVRGIRMHVLF